MKGSTSRVPKDIVNKKFWEELMAYFPWHNTGQIENESNNSFIVACVFVTAVTSLRAVA
jgi:hypothetical protein